MNVEVKSLINQVEKPLELSEEMVFRRDGGLSNEADVLYSSARRKPLLIPT